MLRRHWPLLAVLAAGATVRVLALLAIWPGIWFSDSNTYIETAATGELARERVMGYSLLVWPFHALGSAGALVVVQHVLGVLTGVLLYALLLRRGAPRWLATAGAALPLLDAYLIVVEHAVMAEALYHLTLVAALALLLWRNDLRWPWALLAGLLLGYAAILRTVAVPFLVLVLLYLLVRRVGWRPVTAVAAGWCAVAAAYVGLFAAQTGTVGFTESNGRFLYARVAPFADCRGTPADQRALCPTEALTTNQFLWGRDSPIRELGDDPRIADFARRTILQQPLDYAGVVLGGTLHYFEPGHRIGRNDYPVEPWRFPSDPTTWGYPGYRGPIRRGDRSLTGQYRIREPQPVVDRMAPAQPTLRPGVSRVLAGYQRVMFGHGPLLAVCVLVVLAAVVTRRGPPRLLLDAALLASIVLVALAFSQATSVFSYRYGMIAPVLLPAAAALAVAALRMRKTPASCASSPSTAAASAG